MPQKRPKGRLLMPDDYEIPYTIIFPRGYAAENAWCTICNDVVNGMR
jgi:hypothetical protein